MTAVGALPLALTAPAPSGPVLPALSFPLRHTALRRNPNTGSLVCPWAAVLLSLSHLHVMLLLSVESVQLRGRKTPKD